MAALSLGPHLVKEQGGPQSLYYQGTNCTPNESILMTESYPKGPLQNPLEPWVPKIPPGSSCEPLPWVSQPPAQLSVAGSSHLTFVMLGIRRQHNNAGETQTLSIAWTFACSWSNIPKLLGPCVEEKNSCSHGE